uniref:Prefoldin subunit 5 n=1 Tax=Oryza brachyantha TaxID=4533 RepID=J3N3K7_ORYBR
MASPQRIELDKLSVEQLKAVKEQTDLEVNLLQDSLTKIRSAATRLESASAALHDLSLRPHGTPHPPPSLLLLFVLSHAPSDLFLLGKKMLVPLTASLYVPGTLDDSEKVLVDVGTGYFIEGSTPGDSYMIIDNNGYSYMIIDNKSMDSNTCHSRVANHSIWLEIYGIADAARHYVFPTGACPSSGGDNEQGYETERSMVLVEEKTMTQGKEYCERKINLLKSNFDELVECVDFDMVMATKKKTIADEMGVLLQAKLRQSSPSPSS